MVAIGTPFFVNWTAPRAPDLRATAPHGMKAHPHVQEPALVTATDPIRQRRRSPALALLLRQTHAYVSVFLTPAVLFLAITGSLQVYSFHEAHGAYTPPPILEKLGSVHKDQAFRGKPAHPPGPPKADKTGDAGKPAAPRPPRHDKQAGLPPSVAVLKAFTFAAGLSLAVTACLGLWMALKYTRRPGLCAVLFALGVVVPLATFALPS